MASERREMAFADAIDFQEGPGILARDFTTAGVPLIRLAGLERGSHVLDGCNYLDPETVKKRWAHFMVRKGDVLLSTSASLGRTAVVDEQSAGAIPYTGIIRMRPRDKAHLAADFIPYLLESPHFQRQVEAVGVGSVIRHFGPSHLRFMTVLLPARDEQLSIARILGALDDKIELNRKTSATLEAMSWAMFKSWFVDFDPVHAKTPSAIAPTTQFPSAMTDTDLGRVPAGWRVGPVTALQVDRKYACVAGPFGSNLTSRDYVDAGVPVIRGGNLSVGGLFLNEDDFVFVSDQKADTLEGNLAFAGDVIFTQRGTLGQVAVVPDDTRYPRFVLSQSQMKLTVDAERGSRYYVALYFRQQRVIDLILANGQQAGVPHVNLAFLRKFSVLLPPPEVLRAFDTVVGPWFSRSLARSRESATLASLRDALLPQLLSGELRIPEAERIVGKIV